MIGAIRSFLGRHPAPENKKYVIIWDNAPHHKKAMKEIEIGEECAGIRDSAVFLCLPPCSHVLNPIEQVWRIARREMTRNRFFPNMTALAEAVDVSLCHRACAQRAVAAALQLCVILFYAFTIALIRRSSRAQAMMLQNT